ncbi:prephenate dehydrogenase [Caminibacter mediatlanticus TB-2]|uniref:Prephenate dehydrogenase n=1 Tax=Caminibacter mediatlanticus TB-2 TaxID=391592 RepID=A0AAI9F2A0_9BACT|nr:prephenate dehydrogenase [Caminibacter mediatlanticus TB-2]
MWIKPLYFISLISDANISIGNKNNIFFILLLIFE